MATARNAAKEPEIVDLQDYLRKMGINVRGPEQGNMVKYRADLPDVDKTVIPTGLLPELIVWPPRLPVANCC